jgi:hypothetical protein
MRDAPRFVLVQVPTSTFDALHHIAAAIGMDVNAAAAALIAKGVLAEAQAERKLREHSR